MNAIPKFNLDEYTKQQRVFPEISFEEFQGCNDEIIKDSIVTKNRVLSTDAYNRTMNEIKWPEDAENIEAFSLAFRRTWELKNYNIVYGIKRLVRELLELPITQHEVDFAEAAAKAQGEKWGVGYFNKAMWQKVIDEHNGYIPLTIKAVEDWTAVKKWEPAMLVEWPSELAAHFEPLLLQLFLKSAIAWDMHLIEELIGSWRTIDMGLRSAQTNQLHIGSARSLYVWGWVTATSNDAATACIDQQVSSGTIAHRYLSVRPTEFRDSGKNISMRLDSWDLQGQAIYGLQQIKAAGMIDDPLHNKIVVADISNIDDIKGMELAVTQAGFEPKDHIIYGIGWLLVAKGKTRDAMSAGYKAINTPEGPTGKLSNSPWKEPIPGKPESNDNIALDNARAQVEKSIKWITPWDEPTLSEKTEQIKDQVREKLRGKAA